MDRDEILEQLESMQEDADKQGFKGQNEYDLFLRENIADYIVKLLKIANVVNWLPIRLYGELYANTVKKNGETLIRFDNGEIKMWIDENWPEAEATHFLSR